MHCTIWRLQVMCYTSTRWQDVYNAFQTLEVMCYTSSYLIIIGQYPVITSHVPFSLDVFCLCYGRNNCGKRRQYWLPAPSTFSILFVKGFFLKSVQTTVSQTSPGFYMSALQVFWKHFFHSVYYLFNPFPNKPWLLRVCSSSLLKTLWEKEKLLVTINFSFSHRVFYPFLELSAIFI